MKSINCPPFHFVFIIMFFSCSLPVYSCCIASCSDPAGSANYLSYDYVSGQTCPGGTATPYTHWDYCSTGTILQEAICADASTAAYSAYDCNNYDYLFCSSNELKKRDYFCSSGICTFSDVLISDCDGLDYWECYDGDTERFVDYSCSGGECVSSHTDYDCPNYCQYNSQESQYAEYTGGCMASRCHNNLCNEAYACDGPASKEDGNDCASSCLDDDDDYCAESYSCLSSVCIPDASVTETGACDADIQCNDDSYLLSCFSNSCLRDDGQDCTTGDQCGSGLCVDGSCISDCSESLYGLNCSVDHENYADGDRICIYNSSQSQWSCDFDEGYDGDSHNYTCISLGYDWFSSQSTCCGDDGSSDNFCGDGYSSCFEGVSYSDGDDNNLTCTCGGSSWVESALECCGDDGVESFCGDNYTACYESSIISDGDFNSYVCSCGGGNWFSSQSTCCGDDGSSDNFCGDGYSSCFEGASYSDGDDNNLTCTCGGSSWVASALECCGDDGVESFCGDNYTACYESSIISDGDFNSYVCSCGGGNWFSSQSTCCGDDIESFCGNYFSACYLGSSFFDGDSNQYTCSCGDGIWQGTGGNTNCAGDDSLVYNCTNGDASNVENTVLNQSNVFCSNVSDSFLHDSVIYDNTNISDATLLSAVIDANMLVAGRFVYGEYTYHAPFYITDIYQQKLPFVLGSLYLNTSFVNMSGSFYASYEIGEIGYDVNLDASEVGSDSSVEMRDDGLGNDLFANDGIYTSDDIYVSLGSGDVTLTLDVTDDFENSWTLDETIYVGDSLPETNFYISDVDDDFESEITDSRSVTLHLNTTFSLIEGCRYGNSTLIYEKSFSECKNSIAYVLSPLNGEKTVYFQIKDVFGNIIDLQDNIILDTSILSIPVVDDYGKYWGYDDRVHFNIEIPGKNDEGITYEYRIYNCTNYNSNGCNITAWTYTESSEVWHKNISLMNGINYTIGVKAFSGGVSDEGFSDGFYLDLSSPLIDAVNISVENKSWSSEPFFTVFYSSSDVESGIMGATYRVGKSNILPDSSVDILGNNQTITLAGLSDGVYYLNLKIKNNAKILSDNYNYVIYSDTSRPPIPRISNSSLSGVGSLDINWTSVEDISGIDSYELIVSTDSGFENIVSNYSVNQTFYNYTSTSSETKYYFKVRAKNGAGLYGLYSNQFGSNVDTNAPLFEEIYPQGVINTLEPVLYIRTNEKTTCKFSTTENNTLVTFDYTGSELHEHRISVEDNSEHTFVVTCYDAYDNYNSTSFSFSVDSSKEPSSIVPSVNSVGSYSSGLVNINYTVLSSSTPISGLDTSLFSLEIGSDEIEDFSLKDKGNGVYILSFDSQNINQGTYDLILSYGSIESSPVSFIVDTVSLDISVSLSSSSIINQLSHISYSSQEDYTVGFASDGEFEFNNSASYNRMGIKTTASSGNNYIFFGNVNISQKQMASKNKDLDNNRFLESVSPYFMLDKNEQMSLDIGLDYNNVVFHGNHLGSSGDNLLEITNQGLTNDDKINLSVSLS